MSQRVFAITLAVCVLPVSAGAREPVTLPLQHVEFGQSAAPEGTTSLPFLFPPWEAKNPGNGIVTPIGGGAGLSVTGDDSGLFQSFTGANITVNCPIEPQTPICIVAFQLDSYISNDDGEFDLPAFKFGPQLFGLPHPNGGLVSNDNPVPPGSPPVEYEFELGFSVQGPYHFGFGVFSADGLFGPGIAQFSDVFLNKVPEPGTLFLMGIGLTLGIRRRR